MMQWTSESCAVLPWAPSLVPRSTGQEEHNPQHDCAVAESQRDLSAAVINSEIPNN